MYKDIRNEVTEVPTKTKALLVVIIFIVALAMGVVYLMYLGFTTDDDTASSLKNEATTYINESFPYEGDVTEVINDSTGVYEAFQHAAIVDLDQKDFNMLVFKNEQGQLVDSYVAEVWEDELENVLVPEIESRFGSSDMIKELWIAYPKNIGQKKEIEPNNVPSVAGQDVNPHIRLTINRGEEESDEEDLQALIDLIQSELEVPGGRITLSYNDQAFLFKDSNKSENF